MTSNRAANQRIMGLEETNISTGGKIPSSENPSFFRRLSRFWLRITGPDSEQFTNSLVDQERLRRSRLLSILLTLVVVATILSIPGAFDRPLKWISIIVFALAGVIIAWLNRRGKVTIAGTIYLIAIDMTLVLLMVTQNHGITNGNIPDFDIFAMSILVAGLLSPRQLIAPLAVLQLVVVITVYTILPHDPLLTEEIRVHQQGQMYNELQNALLMEICCATIAWLSAWSVGRALERASQAEELVETRARLDEQNRQIEAQNQRLEYGVHTLQTVLSQVANGEYTARAVLQDNELIPLALTINLLIERLRQIRNVQQEHQRLQQAMHQMVDLQDRLAHGETVQNEQLTKTPLDRFIPFLFQHYRHQQSARLHVTELEEVRGSLQQQQKYLSNSDVILAKAQSALEQIRQNHQQNSFLELSQNNRPTQSPPPGFSPFTRDLTPSPIQNKRSDTVPTQLQETNLLMAECIHNIQYSHEISKQSQQKLRSMAQHIIADFSH